MHFPGCYRLIFDIFFPTRWPLIHTLVKRDFHTFRFYFGVTFVKPRWILCDSDFRNRDAINAHVQKNWTSTGISHIQISNKQKKNHFTWIVLPFTWIFSMTKKIARNICFWNVYLRCTKMEYTIMMPMCTDRIEISTEHRN